MGLAFLGSGAASVGLDIGTDHARVAVLKESPSGLTLAAYASAEVPLGAVVDGEIVDPAAVSQVIRGLWRQPGVKGKDIVTGVSNQKVVVRLIDLPFMERAELQGAIQYQAQDYIPIPIEDAILDFHIVGDHMTPADEHMMDVLLVAAQKDVIDRTVEAVEGAGLRLLGIDVTPLAIVRAILDADTGVLPESGQEDGAVAVVHIGSGLTNIAVVERGVTRFTRVSSLSGNQFTQAIANVLNVAFDDAERMKEQAGLPDISGDAPANPEIDVDETKAIQTARDALEREVNKFVAEVRRSLDYYLTQTSQARTISRIYLTGSGASLRNLSAYLEKGLQTDVVIGDPLRHVTVSPSLHPLVTADRMGAAPAIGLALGGVE